MAKLYVLQCGRTQWADDRRLESVAGVPLSEEDSVQVHLRAKDLFDQDIRAVYAAACESDGQTAQIVSECLAVKWRRKQDLHELNFGLWQGLLVQEIKQRYGKIYRQWREGLVAPPGGEAFGAAMSRIGEATEKILKRHRGQNVLFVLQPIVAALLKCRINGLDASLVWENVDQTGDFYSYDVDQGIPGENV